MASRRASTNSLPVAADLGVPYQIFSEAVSTGRNLAGGKFLQYIIDDFIIYDLYLIFRFED